jgi:small subunit ribosomal protein S1
MRQGRDSMHGKQLVKKFALDPEELDRLTQEALGAQNLEDLDERMAATVGDVASNQIVRGKVLKRKADRIRGWERDHRDHKEGDIVKGKVMRKIKGGLLVDIGVPVFLPASQVDIRRPATSANTSEHVRGEDPQDRHGAAQHRHLAAQAHRRRARSGQKRRCSPRSRRPDRKGVVKNIADFGAFVDLGGIDGLLHITDMSWGRVNHPSELLKIDDEIEVKILNIDRDREKIALGLKQLKPSPWERHLRSYPINARKSPGRWSTS